MLRRSFFVRSGLSLGVAVALAATPTTLQAAEPASAAKGADLVIDIGGFKDSSGQALVSVWSSEDTWLDSEKAFRAAKTAIKDGTARVTVAGLPAGTYAVCVVHDENKNDKLDTKFVGIPKEGIGCSRGAKGRFGPPKWKDAQFDLKTAGAVPVKIGY